MKLYRTIGNLTILGVSLFIGLIICEAVLRYVAPQKLVKTCYQYDEDVALAGVPNCSFSDDWDESIATYEARFNNFGYRMNEDILPQDTNLVACIGDSFTYGWGVEIEDSFWGLIDGEVKNDKAKAKLINAGFPSYSTGHCAKTLERLDDKVSVDKAIYFMFFNDIFDNVRNDKNYVSYTYTINKEGDVLLEDLSGDTVNKKPPSIFKRTLRWLYKRSHLAMLARKSMPDFKDGHSHSGPRAEDQLSKGQIDTMINVSLAHLDNLSQLCQKRDIALQIVWIPCWQELNLKNDFDWVNYFPFEVLKQEMADRYDFYDSTSDINNLLGTEEAHLSDYYYNEGHYNVKGNQLFYKSIREEILGFITAP